MSDSKPQTREEARAASDANADSLTYRNLEPIEFAEVELGGTADFLPLGVRRVLYVLGLAGAVAAPVLAVSSPEYAVAITTAAGLLSVAALGTALANPTR